MTPPSIDSHDALLTALREGASITARWTVRCPIGPSWIGAGRTFALSLDGSPIDPGCEGFRLLTAAITAHFDLPLEHDDEVTEGRAHIGWRDGCVEMDFEWTRGVPYAHPSAADDGTATLRLR